MTAPSKCFLLSCPSPSPDSTTLLKCPCGLVSYCSKACQVVDWAEHKPHCPPYRMVPVPGKGLGLVATRKLNPGVTVIQESPLISVPVVNAGDQEAIRQFHRLSQESQARVLSFYDYMGQSGDGHLVAKLDRIIEFNSVRTIDKDEKVTKDLYFNASMLNHSCKPKLVWYPEKGEIVVRCLFPIQKGSELTVCYFQSSVANYQRGSGCPTLEQRKLKLAPYRFHCRCDLCVRGNLGEERRREEFQRLDRMQEGEGGMLQKLGQAQRKLELAEQLEDQVVFIALIDCWKLSQFISEQVDDDDSVNLGKLCLMYKRKAASVADILGPAAREAMVRFAQVTLDTLEA